MSARPRPREAGGMPETVVCAVSAEEDERTAQVAAGLSGALGIPLVVVHVTGEDADPREGERTLRIAAARVGRGPGVETRLRSGHPALEIVATAAGERAVVVVVGSRGRGLLRQAAMPGVSAVVMARSPSPVVVVPPEVHELALATPAPDAPEPSLVCGVDGSESAATALRTAGRLADALGLRLVAAHVLDPGAGVVPSPQGIVAVEFEDLLERERRDAIRLLRSSLERVPGAGPRELRLVQGATDEGLERLAVEERARLVAVGTSGSGRSPRRAALLGSTALRLAACAPVPVLVARPRR